MLPTQPSAEHLPPFQASAPCNCHIFPSTLSTSFCSVISTSSSFGHGDSRQSTPLPVTPRFEQPSPPATADERLERMTALCFGSHRMQRVVDEAVRSFNPISRMWRSARAPSVPACHIPAWYRILLAANGHTSYALNSRGVYIAYRPLHRARLQCNSRCLLRSSHLSLAHIHRIAEVRGGRGLRALRLRKCL